MVAYIGNFWSECNDGLVFCFSVTSEEEMDLLIEMYDTLGDLEVLPEVGDISFQSINTSPNFDCIDVKCILCEAKTISQEELDVFNKFEIEGEDIFKAVKQYLKEIIIPYPFNKGERRLNSKINNKKLEIIKPLFAKLYGKNLNV